MLGQFAVSYDIGKVSKQVERPQLTPPQKMLKQFMILCFRTDQ